MTFGPWDISAGAVTGSVDELADQLRAFAHAGISHIQVYLGQSTHKDLDTFGAVLDVLDGDHVSQDSDLAARGHPPPRHRD